MYIVGVRAMRQSILVGGAGQNKSAAARRFGQNIFSKVQDKFRSILKIF